MASPIEHVPLTAAQLHALGDARLRMKQIRRAVNVALFDGWTLAIFATLTFLGGLFSPVGFLLGAVLGGIAFIELRGAAQLRSLHRRAPRTLCFNQAILALVLITYALWNLLSPTPLSAEVRSSARELKQMGIDLEQMTRSINLIIYGGLIAVAVLAQGSLALFYFRREKMVADYLQQTPEWISQMQRAGVGV